MMIEIPTADGSIQLELTAGQSAVLIGANGAGKTRLGAFIEQQLSGTPQEVHRIGAHRNLAMNTQIDVVDLKRAENMLRTGTADGKPNHRIGNRWHGKPETALLTDFDHVVRALYSEDAHLSSQHRRAHLADLTVKPPLAKIDRVKEVWESILSHRRLVVNGAMIKVRPAEAEDTTKDYDASDLSDGERVIFYLIGQCIMAPAGCLLIVDEPELHIHKAVLSKVWDAIESKRDDCSFVYLTHDLEFAASRRGATKLVVQNYDKATNSWAISSVPGNVDLPEDVLAKVLGSRQPILFVEGDSSSLDLSIYRRVYSDFTVIAVGGCEQVIHSVATFSRHASLHRFGCRGIIDVDGRGGAVRETLQAKGIHVLPVSEIENLFLLPSVFLEICKLHHFGEAESQGMLAQLKADVFSIAAAGIDDWAVEATKRELDRTLKNLSWSSKDEGSLDTEFRNAVAAIAPVSICASGRSTLDSAIKAGNYEKVLELYDNKGMLSKAVGLLKLKDRKAFEEFLGRTLAANVGEALTASIKAALPAIGSSVPAVSSPHAAVPSSPSVASSAGDTNSVDIPLNATLHATLSDITADASAGAGDNAN